MPVEVVPQWNQRSCFGGFMGKVRQLNTLPATEEDIFTTIGTPQTGLDPYALSAMPLVALNQKDGGNHGASNAGPRRVPRRRSRARHRPVRPTSAGHQRAASLAPTLGAARPMEGPAAAAPIQSSARAGAQSIQSDSRATQVTGASLAWLSADLCQKNPQESSIGIIPGEKGRACRQHQRTKAQSGRGPASGPEQHGSPAPERSA